MFQIKMFTFLKRWMKINNNDNNSFVNDSLEKNMCWPFMVELFSLDDKFIKRIVNQKKNHWKSNTLILVLTLIVFNNWLLPYYLNIFSKIFSCLYWKWPLFKQMSI